MTAPDIKHLIETAELSEDGRLHPSTVDWFTGFMNALRPILTEEKADSPSKHAPRKSAEYVTFNADEGALYGMRIALLPLAAKLLRLESQFARPVAIESMLLQCAKWQVTVVVNYTYQLHGNMLTVD